MQHIVITGTGRAGTTVLVQCFTALGMDTGFTADDAEKLDPVARAGLELKLKTHPEHEVIKAPAQADRIAAFLAHETIDVEAAVIPVRDLFSAAESRRHVYRTAKALNRNPLRQPGGLWKTKNPAEQEEKLALQFYGCLQPFVAKGIPVHLLDFPRFTLDAAYLHHALRPVFARRGISEDDVAAALRDVVKPDLINDFQARRTASAAAETSPASHTGAPWQRWGDSLKALRFF